MRTLSTLILLLLGALLASAAPPKTEAPSEALPEKLAARLSTLDPADPMGYFNLAEDLADLKSKPAKALARQLFVLAYERDRRQTNPLGIGPNVCLALVQLAGSADERRWLEAMGRGLAPPATVVHWEPALQAAATDDGAYELAVALGRYRSQEFRKVRDTFNRLRSPRDVLIKAGMDAREAEALIQQIAGEIENVSNCPRCRGERVIRTSPEGKPVTELCPVCRGNPGPTPALTPERFEEHLRAEALLLGASASGWAAQAQLDRARPFRDVDPAALTAYAGIEPDRYVWRNGAWARP